MTESVLPCPFSEFPAEKMREAARQFQAPDGFVGRVGALIVRQANTEKTFYATEPVRRELLGNWRSLTSETLWPTLAREDVPLMELKNSAGETLSLPLFLSSLFADYPTLPPKQGGLAVEKRKAFWRYAVLDSLRSPAVRLLLQHANTKCDSTPIALNEWWIGPSPAHDVRFDKAFYPPRSSAKPLINWLLNGIAHRAPQPIWPECSEPIIPILFEDDDILVINKPAKLASVPGIKETVNAKSVLEREKGPLFVVHRLDADTSGLLLFAKTKRALSELSRLFRNGDVLKCYQARLIGQLQKERGEILLPLFPNLSDAPRQCVITEHCGGKPSQTFFELTDTQESENGPRSLVSLYPHTGRTHQLRIHCAHAAGLGLAIDGDPFYAPGGLSNQVKGKRLCLHAAELTLPHPTKSKLLHWECAPEFPRW